MPRTCTICEHPDRERIERALLAGESYRNIAAHSGTSPSALVRHRTDHLPAALVRAHDSEEILRADSLLDDVRHGEDRAERLYNAAEAILRRALAAKDLRTQSPRLLRRLRSAYTPWKTVGLDPPRLALAIDKPPGMQPAGVEYQ